jgi:hypothetical protein
MRSNIDLEKVTEMDRIWLKEEEFNDRQELLWSIEHVCIGRALSGIERNHYL